MQATDPNHDYLTPTGGAPVPLGAPAEPTVEETTEETTEEVDEETLAGGAAEHAPTGQYETIGGKTPQSVMDIDPTNLDQNLSAIKEPVIRKLVRERVEAIGAENKKIATANSNKIALQTEIEELLGVAVKLQRAEQGTLFGAEKAALEAVAQQEATHGTDYAHPEAVDPPAAEDPKPPDGAVVALEQAKARRDKRRQQAL